MDRSWMTSNRLSQEYEEGVDKFIQFAFEKLPNLKEAFIVLV
jgi:hypothetical protein